MLLLKEIDNKWKIVIAYWSTKLHAFNMWLITETFDKIITTMLSGVWQIADDALHSMFYIGKCTDTSRNSLLRLVK